MMPNVNRQNPMRQLPQFPPAAAAKPTRFQYFMSEVVTSLPQLGKITALMTAALAAMYGLCKAGEALVALSSVSIFGFGFALASAGVITGIAICIIADTLYFDPDDF